MASYHLYKDGNIINIIEAGLGYVQALKDDGDIDDFIDESTITNPVSLMRNKKGHFVPNISIKTLPDIKSQIATEEIMQEVEKIKEQVSSIAKQANQQIQDVNGAILAIKGFMMEIPNIQKTLLEIQDVIKPK